MADSAIISVDGKKFEKPVGKKTTCGFKVTVCNRSDKDINIKLADDPGKPYGATTSGPTVSYCDVFIMKGSDRAAANRTSEDDAIPSASISASLNRRI